jgi:hypothetical protein
VSTILKPTRTNRFPNPRCVSSGTTSLFGARFNWTRTFGTGDVNTPVGSYVRYTCPSAQTGTSRGLDLYGNLDLASPPAVGLPVRPGDPLSVALAVRSSQAAPFTAAVRFADAAGAWLSAVVGPAAAAGTVGVQWISVSTIVPAGAVAAYIQLRNATSIAWSTGDTIDVAGILIEDTLTPGPYFDGTSTYDRPGYPSWVGTANASPSILSAAADDVTVTDGTTTVGALEIIAASLSRPLRRDALDANQADYLFTAGTPGLLAGRVTFLCASLARGLALEALYQGTALLTLATGGALDGFKHRAVGTTSLTAEKAVEGSPARWLLAVDVREATA